MFCRMTVSTRRIAAFLMTLMLFSGMFTACGTVAAPVGSSMGTSDTNAPQASSESASPVTTPEATASTDVASQPVPSPAEPVVRTDYAAFSPNELGRVPVIMFHKFAESFDEVKDKNYTCTFSQFDALLQTLYDADFRLVSMTDWLAGRIAVPAGKKPAVFTFDDGTASQFSLVDANGTLDINPDCAVAHMIAFAAAHPDFGLEGTFYLTLDMGENTFRGAGTLKERLDRLSALGLEAGSHTWGHVDFTAKGTAADIQAALGKNQQAYEKIDPAGMLRTLALPYGSRPKNKDNRPYLAAGEWEGTSYRHDGVLAVGAGPSPMVYDKRFDALYISRVRATGMVGAEADLDWWLSEAGAKTWYVSDGDPETIIVPQGGDENLDEAKSDGFRVVRYEPAVP